MSSTAALEGMFPQSYVIGRVLSETRDTFTFELRPSVSNGAFTFFPGQFNMLYVFGVGEIPISISGNPEKKGNLVHTTRAVGTVTKAMRRLRKGDTLGVRGPYGTSWPVRDAQGGDIIIVAGGIGIAPLRPVLYHVLAHRENYRSVTLLYGTRTPDDILYRGELEHWRARLDLDVHVTVDRAAPTWKGSVGVVTTLIPRAPFDPVNTVAMVCGPEVMMRFTVQELQKRGIPDSKIFLSLERNMKCGIGLCGHCQYRELFVCKDGPVFSYGRVKDLLTKREV